MAGFSQGGGNLPMSISATNLIVKKTGYLLQLAKWQTLSWTTAILSLQICFLFAIPAISFSTTYYVDSLAGNDRNLGTAETTSWKTVTRVNMQRFSAGDVLLFKRGGEWFDVMINVDSPHLTIGAYGVGSSPRLVGSVEVSDWENRGDAIYSVYFPRPASHKNWKNWEVQLVMENSNRFYKKVTKHDDLTGNGQFYYDKSTQKLYIKPLDPVNSLKTPLYVGRQENIIEIKHARIDRLVVRDLEISLANRYGIGVWWQGDKMTQGSVMVENNKFIGNAFSAVCLSGGMSFDQITIQNNTIRMNGAEGIYIGKYAARTTVEINNNRIGDPKDSNFGWRGEGPKSAFNGDGIDIKSGNYGVVITGNMVQKLKGLCGICTGSGTSIITNNVIKNVLMPGSALPMPAAGIFVDIDDDFGVPQIKSNKIRMSDAAGIHVRGKYTLHPPAVIEDNDIELAPSNPNAQIVFTVMNAQHVKIKGNRGKGGAYGLAFAATPAYPPTAYTVEGNEFLNVSKSPFFFAQSGPGDLKDMMMKSNRVCKGAPTFIEWKSRENVKTRTSAKRVLGSNSVVEVSCQ